MIVITRVIVKSIAIVINNANNTDEYFLLIFKAVTDQVLLHGIYNEFALREPHQDVN